MGKKKKGVGVGVGFKGEATGRNGTVGACKARRRKVPGRLLAAACNLLIQRDERRWSAGGRSGSYRPCEEPVWEDGGWRGSRGNLRPPNEVTLARVLKG